MSKSDEFAFAALSALVAKAEPKLADALARHGVSSPDQLPADVAQQIFQNAVIQTAVESFPDARVDALKHGFEAFRHPLFAPALSKIQAQTGSQCDAFDFAAGVDAAVVLAGLGLSVAPFDRKKPRILGEPSNNIDRVADMFSRLKTAYVGYSPCETPFYMIITDCIKTMFAQLDTRPELHEAKRAFVKSGGVQPTIPIRPFQHGIVLIPREVTDTASTVSLWNPNPNQGSVSFYAGWTVDGTRQGTPNDGYLPVPRQFLVTSLQDPQMAMWIWRPVGAKVLLN